MSRNRATQRHQAPPVAGNLSVMDYFFSKEPGPDGSTVIVPRKDIVRRDELWYAFEWYHRKVTKQNAWYHRLWRALRRAALIRIDPFALIRARGLEGGNPVEKNEPQEEQPSKKHIDATGKVV